jgi:hypothetical protein
MDNTKRLEQLEAKTKAQADLIAHYEKKLGIGGETPLAMKGFLAYQKLLEQQINHIDNFKLTSDILEGKKSADALWERTEKIHNELPEKISSLNKLKTELKIEFDETEGKPKMTATSPQSLMNLNGN